MRLPLSVTGAIGTFFLFISSSLWAGDIPTGYWVMPDSSAVLEIKATNPGADTNDQIYEVNIVRVLEDQFDSADGPGLVGKPRVDIKNPDKSLRNRALPGITIGYGFKFESGKLRGGKVYDPDSGNTYRAEMVLEEDGLLRVKAFLGFSFLGETLYWRPVGRFQESLDRMFGGLAG